LSRFIAAALAAPIAAVMLFTVTTGTASASVTNNGGYASASILCMGANTTVWAGAVAIYPQTAFNNVVAGQYVGFQAAVYSYATGRWSQWSGWTYEWTSWWTSSGDDAILGGPPVYNIRQPPSIPISGKLTPGQYEFAFNYGWWNGRAWSYSSEVVPTYNVNRR
jgi:hypothetical protein